MIQTLKFNLTGQSYRMKQSSMIFLVLVYLFYTGKCQTILPSETTEMSEVLLPDGNEISDRLKDLLRSVNMSCSYKPYDTEDLPKDVIFQLYTRSAQRATYTTLKPTKEADVGDFNNQRQTKFMIHGWLSNGEYLAPIRKGYLEAGDYNVIVVDWSKRASDVVSCSIKNHLKVFGEYLASLIDILVMYHGLRLEDVHIVGHSLGAQMAAIAGNKMQSGKPGRITGLDPAMPGFCSEDLENRLDVTDAQFVDVIHTCGGIMAWKTPLGHADFYPNDGTATQPGCNEHPEAYKESFFPPFASCSHGRVLDYFAESITTISGFVSYECPSWDDYKHGNCFQNSRTLMGEFTNTRSRGSYYLQTAKSAPFALGNISTVADVDSASKESAINFAKLMAQHVQVC